MPERGLGNEEELSKTEAEAERESLQERVSNALDLPLTILALIWVALLVIELALQLPPDVTDRVIKIDTAIWVIFVIDFAIEFALAPHKLRYLRANVLVALSLVLPFARIFRVFRLAAVLRSVSLVRVTLVANRATMAFAEIFKSRGFHYVLALTAAITLLSAAAVYFFERDIVGTPYRTFWDVLWWAATMVTTINVGTDPITLEGRVVGLLLRAYAMAIFGYVAASIASYLVGRRVSGGDEQRSQREAIDRLSREVERLNTILDQLRASQEPADRSDG